MVDRLTPERRSWLMARVKSTNTLPELQVRSALHRLGYRFRLHVRGLAGKPDLVFPSRKKVIFVHGCFWHGHVCRMGSAQPKTNVEFWQSKIERNQSRDKSVVARLRREGWGVATIWQCELQRGDQWLRRIQRFLERTYK